MKSFTIATHLLQLIIPILLTLLPLLSVSSASDGPKCTLIQAPSTVPSVLPKSELVEDYYQPPTKQPPAEIVDRLESESKIRNKLSLYSLVLSGKNYSNFDRIFTEDALVSYSSTIGVFKGLPDLKEAVQKALEPVDTQLLLGTEVIKVYEDNPCMASSLTYFTVTLFGKGEFKGKSSVFQGEYRDIWVRNEAGEWFISVRFDQISGFPIGDLPVS